MYKIIGADGKEYGPITSDQLRQWIAEGRANAQTRVLAEGSTEWKPLADMPEFSQYLGGATSISGPSGPPPYSPTIPTGRGDPLSQVQGPAIGLIAVAILNFLGASAGIILNLAGASFMPVTNENEAWVRMFSGTLGLVTNIVSLAIGILILFGGLKMRKLEGHGLAVTASILSILPCTSPCCLVGLPIGIWALVVLFRPEVKSSFR